MEIKLRSKKAISLIELISVLVVFLVVLLALFSILISQFQYLYIFQAEGALKGEATYIIERMKKTIMNSEHVDIQPGGQSLNIYNRDGTLTDNFTYNGATLTYTDATIAPSAPETISTNIGSMIFDDAQISGNTSSINVLKVTLKTQDPKRPGAQGAEIITSIACRFTPTTGNTVFNFNRNTYYDAIKTALNDTVFQSGDEIRCMGKVAKHFDGIFLENITITKSVILKGSYDRTFTNQSTASTPTTIDAQQALSVIKIDPDYKETTANITINSFTIQNAKKGTYNDYGYGICNDDSTGNRLPPLTITITNNRITSNAGAGIYLFSYIGYWPTPKITIANNDIEGNNPGIYINNYPATNNKINLCISNNLIDNNKKDGWGCAAGIQVVPGTGSTTDPAQGSVIDIRNNTITNNISSTFSMGGGIGIRGTGASNYSNVNIINNTISHNRADGNPSNSDGGGIHVDMTNTGETYVISNNTITDNHVTGYFGSGGGIYFMNLAVGSVSINHNFISDNTTTWAGGGMNVTDYASNPMIIANNIIVRNNTTDGSSGLNFSYYSDNPGLIIRYNTIADNISGNVGAIGAMFSVKGATITRSICYGNALSDFQGGGGWTTISDSDVGTLDPSTYYTQAQAQGINCINNVSTSPQFNHSIAPYFPTNNTDMGAYAGPGGLIGVQPTVENDSTPDIREGVIGRYDY